MKFFCFLFLLTSTNAYCLTKEDAVQLSKSRISGLLPHFASLAYNCFLFAEDCQIQGYSQEATLKWLSSESSRFDAQLSYDSGVEKFLIDGAIRIAKTGKTLGSPVIFNEDLLAQEISPGRFEALGFFEILGVLVHEFGHHQEASLLEIGLRPLEHHELDLISAKVVAYLKDRTRRIQLGPDEVPGLKDEDRVNIYQIDIEWNNGVRNQWSNIFVDSRSQTVEISRQLLRGLRCPRTTSHGHVTFLGEPYYAAFRKVRAPQIKVTGEKIALEQEVGGASLLCVDNQMDKFHVFDGYKNGALHLEFSRQGDGRFLWDSAASNFRAEVPPDEQGL